MGWREVRSAFFLPRTRGRSGGGSQPSNQGNVSACEHPLPASPEYRGGEKLLSGGLRFRIAGPPSSPGGGEGGGEKGAGVRRARRHRPRSSDPRRPDRN